MQITRTICDRCGAGDSKSVSVPTGRYRSCAAGGRSESVDLQADLCFSCVIVLFELIAGVVDQTPEQMLTKCCADQNGRGIGVKVFQEI